MEARTLDTSCLSLAFPRSLGMEPFPVVLLSVETRHPRGRGARRRCGTPSSADRRHGTRRHPAWHTTGTPRSPASPPRCASRRAAQDWATRASVAPAPSQQVATVRLKYIRKYDVSFVSILKNVTKLHNFIEKLQKCNLLLNFFRTFVPSKTNYKQNDE